MKFITDSVAHYVHVTYSTLHNCYLSSGKKIEVSTVK